MKITKTDRKVLELLQKGKGPEDIGNALKISKLDAQFSIIRLKREGLYKEKKDQFGDKIKEPSTPTKKTGAEKKEKKALYGTPEQRIETGADKLLDIVESEKNITLEKVANDLNLDLKIIEDWARVLEEHDLIKMHYPIFGKPMLRTLDYKTEKHKKKEKGDVKPVKDKKLDLTNKFEKRKKPSKKPPIIIIILFLIILFFYLGNIGNLPPAMNVVVKNTTNTLTTALKPVLDLLDPILNNRFYFELSIIIIIVVIVILIILKKKSGGLKLWVWKKKHM
ncbi:MAG: hypothetical protein ABIH52_01020 [Candidatus Aenigmatarchaeota archaeon]